MIPISLENIAKRFEGVSAISNLSLTIPPGSLFFLLGPSGCGKTTLLRLIAGFITPDQGRILLDRQDVASLPPERRGVGMVFQHYALWPHLSVERNVEFGLRLRGLPRHERRVAVQKALAMVKLEHHASRFPHELSGGEQQRVALARALVLKPQVLLLDEPLANLDEHLRAEVRQEITQLHRELGLTMVLVTHDYREALATADSIALLDRGTLVQLDSPRALYDHPASPFVAQFFGGTNLLSGVVTQHSAEASTVDLPFGPLRLSATHLPYPVGTRVLLSLRYHSLALCEENHNQLSVNSFSAIVSDTAFHGSHLFIEFAMADHSHLVAHLPPTTTAPSRGSSCIVQLLNEAPVIFPADS